MTHARPYIRLGPNLYRAIGVGVLSCCTSLPGQAFAAEVDGRQGMPVSQFGTSFGDGQFFGGSGRDTSFAMTHTADGDIVICGHTTSMDIGTTGAAYPNHAGSSNSFNPYLVYDDAFVTKLSGTTGAVLFTTYLGGTRPEICFDVVIDSSGNIIVAGQTQSADFPTVNAFDATFAGGGTDPDEPGSDGFVTKLSADGSTVLFSTFVGGDDVRYYSREEVRRIAVAPGGSIYLAGDTNAANFPATFLLDGRGCLADQSPTSTSHDVFLVKLTAAGTLEYATCMGGESLDRARGIGINSAGGVLIGGTTASTDFALTNATFVDVSDPVDANDDVYLVEFDEVSMSIVKSVRIGGNSLDYITEVKFGADGSVVLGGYSFSMDFPTTTGAFQETITPYPNDPEYPMDMIIISVMPTLTGLNFATFVGSEPYDSVHTMELDEQNQVWFTSGVETFELPTVNAPVASDLNVLSGEMLLGPETVGANAIAITRFIQDDVVIYARNGQNYFSITDPFDANNNWTQPMGPATGDSRDVSVAVYSASQVAVIGNFGSPNHYYSYLYVEPVEFGASDSNTTHVAISHIDFNGGVFFEANDGQPNNAYSFTTGQSPVQIGVFGNPLDETVGLASVTGGLVEAVAPNRLRFYSAYDQTSVVLTAEFELDGLNITEVNSVYWSDSHGYSIANSAGPSEFVRLIYDSVAEIYTLERTVIDPAQTDIDSMIAASFPTEIWAHGDGVLHRYTRNMDGSVTKIDELPSLPAGARFAKSYATYQTGEIVMANPAGPATLRHFSRENLYLGALSPDGSDLVFGAYAGGDGRDLCCTMSRAPDGRMFVGAYTDANNFTGVNDLNTSGQRQVVYTALTYPLDVDQDSISDLADNCQLVANPLQQDTNSDGIGNACDPDLNDDGIVNFVDLNVTRLAFFSTPGQPHWNPDADFNSDLVVNFLDLEVARSYFFGPPGPAAQSL